MINKILWTALGLCLLAGPAQADDPSTAPMVARLYDGPDQTGTSLEIKEVNPDFSFGCASASSTASSMMSAAQPCAKPLSKQVKSVLVNASVKLVLWSEPNYQGRAVVLGPGQHNLKDYGFDSVASSGAIYLYNEGAVPFFNRYYRSLSDPRTFWVGAKVRCSLRDEAQMLRMTGQQEVMLASPDIALPTGSKECRV
jgi:hypothetical protein